MRVVKKTKLVGRTSGKIERPRGVLGRLVGADNPGGGRDIGVRIRSGRSGNGKAES